jgi:hypothetical protein
MKAPSERLSRLELEALCVALSRYDIPEVRDLVRAIPLLRVVHRKHTGFGFFSKFLESEEVQRPLPMVNPPSNRPPSAIGFHPDLDGFVDFSIWIKDGEIKSLTASSTDAWPDDETKFVVSAWPGPKAT